MPSKTNLIFVVLFLLFAEAKAHGDLSIRIKEKTTEISKSPNNAKLYFERGYLFQLHEEYNKALKDFIKSERLGLDTKILHHRKAETYFEANKLKKALKENEKCLTFDDRDIKTYKLKAKILFKLKQYKEAISAYDYVIQNTIDLQPEDYLNYSEFVLAIDKKDFETAIKTLELGMKNSGTDVLSFQLKKIEYLKKLNQTENVINLYNKLIVDHDRKEFFYFEKAKYLFEIGDFENANIALQQSKLSINQLKIKSQNTNSVKKLQTKINKLEIQL